MLHAVSEAWPGLLLRGLGLIHGHNRPHEIIHNPDSYAWRSRIRLTGR